MVEAFKFGYDAGQSARPEPPEPDGDLVAVKPLPVWCKGMDESVIDAETIILPVYLHTNAVTGKAEILDANGDILPKFQIVEAINSIQDFAQEYAAQQHAARADAPADVCEAVCSNCNHPQSHHRDEPLSDCILCDEGCEKFTPAPTSPERRGEWIRVSERLPDEDEPVLTSTDTAYNAERRMYTVDIQAFCEGEWETEDVVAWMPLPAPYKVDLDVYLVEKIKALSKPKEAA